MINSQSFAAWIHVIRYIQRFSNGSPQLIIARDYEPALETIGDYLKNFARHQRVNEAHVLRGDILMGQGFLEEATASFDSVSWESPDMYLYSLFQRGKIYRALEDYPSMVQMFKTFLDEEESPKIRVSEALYWLGLPAGWENRSSLPCF
ncbi:MAG: hypothetical protein P8L44_17675 [Opitutales bacterium]|nr:hypothetical protein [Opitutales bacterium]